MIVPVSATYEKRSHDDHGRQLITQNDHKLSKMADKYRDILYSEQLDLLYQDFLY